MDRLESLRSQIEKVNGDILGLLNQRIALSLQIADIKKQQGVEFFDPAREKHMLDHLKEHNDGPLSAQMLEQIFREIFHVSRTCMQKKFE
ncbi:chorismate mutase [Candidatus Uabimicrobium amorphum]|nr:chorismate mutase [Candidatus Uabimicrobium amorphum]